MSKQIHIQLTFLLTKRHLRLTSLRLPCLHGWLFLGERDREAWMGKRMIRHFDLRCYIEIQWPQSNS